MATNEKGILGGFSGKVGTVIGGSWNGKDYMRGKPARTVNPQTEKQQNQRAKVGMIIQFLRPMTGFLRVGFKKQAVNMSAFNAAASYNIANAVTGISPDFEIDYSKIMVSQGKLSAALNPRVSLQASDQIEFLWDDNSTDREALPNDRALLLVVDAENGNAISMMEGSNRTSGRQIFTLPASFSGAELQCYIAFQNSTQTDISDSRYAGTLLM